MLRLQSIKKITKPYMYGYEIRVANNSGCGIRFEIVRAYQHEWYVFSYCFTKESETMMDKSFPLSGTYRTSRTAAQAVKEYIKNFNRRTR